MGSNSNWCGEKESTDDGDRLYIRAPGCAQLGSNIGIQIGRESNRPFLTQDGWSQESQVLTPASIRRDGNDLLLEIPSTLSRWIDDFEPISISIEGTEIAGNLPWVFKEFEPITIQEPKNPGPIIEDQKDITQNIPEPPKIILKSGIRLTASARNVQVGRNVTLTWSAENIEELCASGDWNGRRPLEGKATVSIRKVGENVFALTAVGSGEPVETAVTVFGQEAANSIWERVPKSILIGAPLLLLALLVVTLLWPSSDNRVTLPEPEPLPRKPLTPEDKFEQLKKLIAAKMYQEARSLLYDLTGNGHTGAAVIGAEAIGNPNFQSGLFDRRNNKEALSYYRLACEGGSGGKSSLEQWAKRLEDEQETQYSEEVADLIREYIPQLLQTCKD